MFHSQSLSRKGPLGSIWVAAYSLKRLKKAQVTQIDIPCSVDTILQDDLDVVAYRILAYFLLGVVRIFSKKVEYLFDDCHKVLVEMKAFVVSNRKDKHAKFVTAPPLSSITVPKSFELDAFDLEVLEDFSGGNVASREDITLRDNTWGNKGIWEDSLCEYHWGAGHDTFSFDENPVKDVSSSQPMEIDAVSLQIDFGPSAVEEQNNLEASIGKPQEGSFTQEKCMNTSTLLKGKEDTMDSGRLSSNDNMIDREQTRNVKETLSVKETLVADNKGSNGDMFHASPEKIRIDEYVESMNIKIADGVDKEPVELTVKSDERLLTFLNGDNLKVPSPQSQEAPVVMKDHPVSAQLSATPEPKLPDPQGATAPDFLLIPTPKVKERPRNKRKMNCLYDELIMLPNEVIKKSIYDSSELVCKRRKAPHTDFAAWKAHRKSYPSLEFMVPLMSGMSPELITLFSERDIKISEVHEPAGGIEKTEVKGPEKIGIPELHMLDGSSEQIEIAPETPDQCTSSRRPFSSPKEDSRLDQIGFNVFSEVANLVEEQNELGDHTLDFSLMIGEPQETGVPKEDYDELGHWTGRTRLVARRFHKIFENQNRRGEPEVVSLLHVLERKTAKENARLFYEILVLKTRRCVDVGQDEAYSDIIVKKDAKWEQAFGAGST